MVDFMLSVLSCGYDPARKNAVLFLGGAIHFRAVLAIFDRSNGLARILDCLRTVLMLLHGQQDLKTEKQVRFLSLGVTFAESHICSEASFCRATGSAEDSAGSCRLSACQCIGSSKVLLMSQLRVHILLPACLQQARLEGARNAGCNPTA